MAMTSQSHQVLRDEMMLPGFEVLFRSAKAAQQRVMSSPSQKRQWAKGAE